MGNKYQKGKVIHKTKASAQKIVNQAKSIDLPAKIVKVKGGYRVDKKW